MPSTDGLSLMEPFKSTAAAPFNEFVLVRPELLLDDRDIACASLLEMGGSGKGWIWTLGDVSDTVLGRNSRFRRIHLEKKR